MATLSALKTRIITETDRADLDVGQALEEMLSTCIAQAIEHYADECFWFNRASGTTTTAAADASADLPAGLRLATAVSYAGALLRKVPADSISYRTGTGPPSLWAERGGELRLWPIPDAAYTLDVEGIADLGVPASSNAWTAEGYDLIAARTRFLLFRDVFRDAEGTQLAAQAEGEALQKLRRETRRRAVVPLRSTGDEPWTAETSFNVNRGN